MTEAGEESVKDSGFRGDWDGSTIPATKEGCVYPVLGGCVSSVSDPSVTVTLLRPPWALAVDLLEL